MDEELQKELIIKNVLEVLQNVMPTNIMDNLDKLDVDEEDGGDRSNDLDEDRFFYEFFTAQTATPNMVVKKESNDNTESLTYFQIVEQEMAESLPVTKYNIELLKVVFEDFGDITADILASLNLQTISQLTNILLYSLMTAEDSKHTEEMLSLEPNTVNKMLTTICAIIASKKDVFIHWPNRKEIQQNVRQFEKFNVFGEYEFYSVFGALGTIDIHLQPPVAKYLSFRDGNNVMYTPVKWQCSCDVSGFLQSSSVLIPKKENETKNSYVFEVNPLKDKLETIKNTEYYLVADETLTLIPYLLTPHEKLLLHAEQYNRALESKRKIIDVTFDKIRSRFAILSRIELRDAPSICNLIDTIGILHNFFLVQGDELYNSD